MQYTIDRRRDLSRPGEQSELWPHALLVQGDADAALWRVRVTDGGQAVDLTGVAITAQVIRPSGVTVELTGSASGSVASMTLDGNCFAEGGEITCRMIATDGGESVTLDLVRVPVRAFSVGRILDPEERLPSLPELLEQLGRLEGAISAAQALTDTPAYIGANGNWYVFDESTQAYVDSGVAAQGPTGAPGAPGVAAVNLLDNSNFASPVNQRGQTAYTAEGYGIDRWIVGAGAQLTIDEGASVTLTATGSEAAKLTQRLPGDVCTRLTGKTATIAATLTDGTLLCAAGAIRVGAQASTLLTAANGSGSIALTADADGTLALVLAAGVGESLSVCWAALYEGTYTADTLPSYRPRAASVELLECQRYLYIVRPGTAYLPLCWGLVKNASTIWYNVVFPTQMRVIPTFTYGGDLVCNASIYDEISDLSIRFADTQRAMLAATAKSGAQVPDTSSILCGKAADAYLMFSAEL